jgi:hypothetical protein
MANTPQKSDVLNCISAGYDQIETLVASLTEAQLTESPAGGWSIKDHLVHLTAWERLLLHRVQGHAEREHEVLRLDPAAYAALSDWDSINAIIYQRGRDRPLTDVLAEFRDVSREVVTAVEHATDDELARPWPPDEPGAPPLIANVAGNTYEHFAEHLDDIHAILDT